MLSHRFAILLAVLTFVLLLVGGTVNPSGSSLACPDWPLCDGQVFPEMTGGVLFEHSHRLVATLVGFVTLIFAGVTWKTRREEHGLVRLAFTLVVLVIVQGVLGGLTVILRLPPEVSIAHLGLSMIYFLLVIHAAFRTAPAWRANVEEQGSAGGVRMLVFATGLATYLQVLSGGLVRHLGAGRACGQSFPDCGGVLWPGWWGGQLHQLHRLFGFLVFALIVVAAVVAYRRATEEGRTLARFAAAAAPVLATLQVLLGILTVTSGIQVMEATLHLGGGALLLADLFVLHRALGPHLGPSAVLTPPPNIAPAEAVT